MRPALLAPLLLTVLLMSTAAADGGATPVGVWRGTSLCTVKPSPCHDETVVYHVTAGKGAHALVVQASRVVDGKELDMGTLDCTWDRERRAVTCRIEKGVFDFRVDGARMSGTLKLTDGTLFRRIAVEKTP